MNESEVYLPGGLDQEAPVPNELDFNRSFYNASFFRNDTPWSVRDDNLWDLATERAGLAVVLILFSVATVFGNMLVILAVIRERYLHTATNYFVTSLAFADCLVGLVVMPFSAIYEVLENRWLFTTDWCDVWRSLDVLFSTASILNLCVISLDRYWAITDPFTYPTRMSRKRAAILIAIVWICSSAISFPAIAWWRAVRTEEVPKDKCPFTEHLGYLIFSSTISFYLPLFVMVFTYYRIYRAAVIQTRSLKLGTKQVMMASGELELTLRIHRGGATNADSRHLFRMASSTPEDLQDLEEPLTALHNNGLTRLSSARINNKQNISKNFSLSRKLAKFAKEKKAAKTLGIVMGVFIVCWLPFFVVNLWSGFCTRCIWQEEMVSAAVTWLGWINSGMNPVIYACWSRDFRRCPHTSFRFCPCGRFILMVNRERICRCGTVLVDVGDISQKKEDDCTEFNFTYLRRSLHRDMLPSRKWGFNAEGLEYCALQKMEDDLSVRKRIAILPNMRVKIYLDNKIIPLTEFIILISMEQFTELLKSVDEIPLPEE